MDEQFKERALKEWEEFLHEFPLERLSKLTLEDYCIGGDNKNSFCEFLENRTRSLGAIARNNFKQYKVYLPDNLDQEQFSLIKRQLVEIAGLAREKNQTLEGSYTRLDAMESKNRKSFQFAPSVLWKIAFLYQNKEGPWIYPVFEVAELKFLLNKEVRTVREGQELLRKTHKNEEYWATCFKLLEKLEKIPWRKAIQIAEGEGFKSDEVREYVKCRTLIKGSSSFLILKSNKDVTIYIPEKEEQMVTFLQVQRIRD